MTGKKIDALLDELNIDIDRAVPGEHGHLIERYVRTVTEGVRACRLQAGLPPSSWPAALEMWLDNWNETVANATKREDCDVSPIPYGAAVRYMPADEDKVKERRFEASARVGIVVGYAKTVPRAYLVADLDLLKTGKWRVTTTRAAKPLVDSRKAPVFPAQSFSPKERKTVEGVFNRRAGGSGGAVQLAMSRLEADFDLNTLTDSALVTRLLEPSECIGPQVDAARRKEADALNAKECVVWESLAEWDGVRSADKKATRVRGRTIVSEKHAELELADEDKEIKARYILTGCCQFDAHGRNVAKHAVDVDMVSAPIQIQNLQTLLTAGIRAGKGRTTCGTADEANAYINEHLGGDAVWLDVRSARDLVPEHLRPAIDAMRFPVVRVSKAMYGLRRSVFDYEAGRDRRLADRDVILVRGSKCIYRYTNADGHTCFFGVFIDDQIAVGHDSAVRDLFSILAQDVTRPDGTISKRFEFKEEPRIGLEHTILGLSLQIELFEDRAVASLGHEAYATHWVSKFESEFGLNLREQRTPAAAPAPTSETKGRFADVARSYTMAALYGARMVHVQMLHGVSSLTQRFNSWGSDEDRRLLHVLGFWKAHAADRLECVVGYDDALDAKIYSDTDHGSDIFTRRSTTGGVLMYEGDVTRVNIANISRMQPKVSRSSGEAETVGVSEVVQTLLDEHEQIVEDVGGSSQTMAKLIPLLALAEEMDIEFANKRLLVDASTALTAVTKGYSKVMAYMGKTQGINLAFLSETIRDLQFVIEKVASSANIADLHTKAVTAAVLQELTPRIGIHTQCK